MVLTKHFLVVFTLLVVSKICDGQGLKLGYYRKTCPKVEAIVKQETTKIITTAPTLAAPLLRMHFHDCFVRVRWFMFYAHACILQTDISIELISDL